MAEGRKKFLFALSILIGSVIGAGLFGIPYVISKSGLIPGLFYFLILGVAMVLIHLFFGEILLSTKGKHRLPGLAKKYIGGNGEKLALASIIIGSVGALLAYIVIGGDFLEILFSSGETLHLNIFFGLVGSYFIFRGVRLIAPTEIITNALFFLIMLIIFLFALPEVNIQNFTLFNLPDMFIPYGVILFSLIGLSAIPEASEVLKSHNQRKSFKKVVIFSFLIIIFFYLIFAFFVVGTSGTGTSSETFQGLKPFLGSKVIFWGALAAVITLIDSFIVLGLHLKNVLIYDYRVNKVLAATVVCVVPLILFLIGFRNFISIIGLVGIIVGTIQGIIVILIFKKIKKLRDREPEYSLKIPHFVLHLLILIFVLGVISQFL